MTLTEERIRQTQKSAKARFKAAERQMGAQITKYLSGHEKTVQRLEKQVETGDMTEAEYKKQVKRQVFSGKQWKKERLQMAETLYRTNEACAEDLNDQMDDVYMRSYNEASYETEKHYGRDVGTVLMTAALLAKLKKAGKADIPYRTVNKSKDIPWNMKRIQREVEYAVERGKDLYSIGKTSVKIISRKGFKGFETVADYVLRSVDAMGDYDALVELERLGIDIEKQWLATLDQHTRDTHRTLDHQIQPLHDDFVVGGYTIMYPRQPSAPPEMIINCRCTMKKIFPKYQHTENAKRRENIKDPVRKIIPSMSYREWEKWKHGKN